MSLTSIINGILKVGFGILVTLGIIAIVVAVIIFFYWLEGREVKRVKKKGWYPTRRFCNSCGKWKDKKKVKYLMPKSNRRLCNACYMRMFRQIKDGKYD